MKQVTVIKSIQAQQEDLEKIHQYTMREFTEQELYLFSVVLCDNEIDRDYEYFTEQALVKLSQLYLGKTGIFDHDPKGENQTARIYDTEVLRDHTKKTQYGEPYTYLKAKAYMVRSEKNRDLILEIDAGIKKEVSVGCSVTNVICSICGADLKTEHCNHIKGKTYQGKTCCNVLSNPVDAYEWSFVAVPAQRNAGVIKMFGDYTGSCNFEQLKKKFWESQDSITLSKQEIGCLTEQIQKLEQLKQLGEDYLRELRNRVVKLAFLTDSQLNSKVVASVAEKMSVEELKSFQTYYEKKLSLQQTENQMQLGQIQSEQSNSQYESFKI